MSIIKLIRQYRLVNLRIASYNFNPGVLSTLITIIMLYVMMSLGFWQLDRASFKETLQQTIEQRKTLPATGLAELEGSLQDRRYRPVDLTGHYDAEHSFLLDNVILNGRVGYQVLTPFVTSDADVVLVARGFLPLGQSRKQLPKLDTSAEEVMITGLIDMPPSRALVLAEDVQQTEQWPVVLQYVDLAEIAQLLGYPLYDMQLWLDADNDSAYRYNLPALNLNAAKNNGYAFQWFAMSLALLIIYLVVNTKRR